MPHLTIFAHFLATSPSHPDAGLVNRGKVIQLPRQRGVALTPTPDSGSGRRELLRRTWSIATDHPVQEAYINPPQRTFPMQPVTSFLMEMGVHRDGELVFDTLHLVFYP